MLNKQIKRRNLGFRLDRQTARRFERLARKDGGVSKILRSLVAEYLERRKVA